MTGMGGVITADKKDGAIALLRKGAIAPANGHEKAP
jgi:hypothetical protein